MLSKASRDLTNRLFLVPSQVKALKAREADEVVVAAGATKATKVREGLPNDRFPPALASDLAF